jgi:isoleucyl-tRNA synthetase
MTQKEGYMSEATNGVTVVMDMNLTDELLEEGTVGELISKIQTMRKDAGFEVMDHIKLYFEGNETIAKIVQKNKEAIARKVLAEEIKYEEAKGSNALEPKAKKEWNINGEKVTIGVEKNV